MPDQDISCLMNLSDIGRASRFARGQSETWLPGCSPGARFGLRLVSGRKRFGRDRTFADSPVARTSVGPIPAARISRTIAEVQGASDQRDCNLAMPDVLLAAALG